MARPKNFAGLDKALNAATGWKPGGPTIGPLGQVRHQFAQDVGGSSSNYHAPLPPAPKPRDKKFGEFRGPVAKSEPGYTYNEKMGYYEKIKTHAPQKSEQVSRGRSSPASDKAYASERAAKFGNPSMPPGQSREERRAAIKSGQMKVTTPHDDPVRQDEAVQRRMRAESDEPTQKAKVIGSTGSGEGNPYHDEEGKFTDEAHAKTIVR